jgi:hypothetical protein
MLRMSVAQLRGKLEAEAERDAWTEPSAIEEGAGACRGERGDFAQRN